MINNIDNNKEQNDNKNRNDKNDDITSEEIDPDNDSVQFSRSDDENFQELDEIEVADNWDDDNEVTQELPKQIMVDKIIEKRAKEA